MANKEYHRKYYQDHKEKLLKKSKIYRDIHKEEIQKGKIVYRRTHKKQIKESNKKYREKNLETLCENSKQYYYENIEKIKEYNKDKNGKVRSKRYAEKNPEKIRFKNRKTKLTRKNWGFNPINNDFKEAHFHHLHINNNRSLGIFIPKELHKSIYHAYNNSELMNNINKVALEWLCTQEIL